MSERTYYVLCNDNCRFESMTKEQILASITQAVEGHQISNVDTGFVTKIKEMNGNQQLQFWIGTSAQYNALEAPLNNCMYIITDDTTGADLEADIVALQADVDDLQSRMVEAEGNMTAVQGRLTTAEEDIDTLDAQMLAQQSLVTNTRTRLTAVEEETESIDGRLTTAESDIDGVQSRMTSAETNISGLQRRMTTAESDIDGAQADITAIKDNKNIKLGLDSYSPDGVSAVAIGKGASCSSEGSVAIGRTALVSTSDGNTIQLGDNAVSNLRCAVALTVTSDERDKTDIVPVAHALDFVKAITPIQYVSNRRSEYVKTTKKAKEDLQKYGLCEYDKEAHTRGDKKGERKRVGFKAQEIVSVMQELFGTDNYADIVNDNFHDLTKKPADIENQLTVAYQNMIPFLVGAIKEQQTEIEELRAMIEEQRGE